MDCNLYSATVFIAPLLFTSDAGCDFIVATLGLAEAHCLMRGQAEDDLLMKRDAMNHLEHYLIEDYLQGAKNSSGVTHNFLFDVLYRVI